MRACVHARMFMGVWKCGCVGGYVGVLIYGSVGVGVFACSFCARVCVNVKNMLLRKHTFLLGLHI